MSEDSNQLTDLAFWDSYWSGLQLPQMVDSNFSFDRCLSEKLAEIVGTHGPQSAIELGAAPGKWVHFLSSLGLRTAGVDSSPRGFEVMKANLRSLEVAETNLFFGNVETISATDSYDLVASFGLVEHFREPLEILSHHVKWLSSSGLLVIGVPNFTGFHGMIQCLLDNSVFDSHNTRTMHRGFFEDVSAKLGLSLIDVSWIGSIEPTLPMISERQRRRMSWRLTRFPVRTLMWLLRQVRRFRFLDRVNHPWLSAYIVAVMQKPPA